jgi:hypothetical protein
MAKIGVNLQHYKTYLILTGAIFMICCYISEVSNNYNVHPDRRTLVL